MKRLSIKTNYTLSKDLMSELPIMFNFLKKISCLLVRIAVLMSTLDHFLTSSITFCTPLDYFLWFNPDAPLKAVATVSNAFRFVGRQFPFTWHKSAAESIKGVYCRILFDWLDLHHKT